jgi:hypothetical protein
MKPHKLWKGASMRMEISGPGSVRALFSSPWLKCLFGERGMRAPRALAPCLIAAACVIFASTATFAQSDLAVVAFTPHTPSVAPGGELLVDITIQNMGVAPTTVSAIMNYVFIWDVSTDTPELQLCPTDNHVAHTLHPLGPGETDVLSSIGLTIPADMPLDTVITIAVVTDWADLEPEPDELNNMSMIPIVIEPMPIPFLPTDVAVFDNIDIEGYPDTYQFEGIVGIGVYAEIVAERMGSSLDSRLLLLGPEPDSILALEGYASDIGLDSRVTHLDLPPSPDFFRLEVMGDYSTTGMFELRLQQAVPETEPNDDPSVATAIGYGSAAAGCISYPGDIDYYSFTAAAEDMLILDFDADESIEVPSDSLLDPHVLLLNSAGDTLMVDDDASEYDPYIRYALRDPDTYYLKIEDALGRGFPDNNYVFKLTQITGIPKPDLEPMNVQPFIDPVQAGDSIDVSFESWNIGGLETFIGGVCVDIALSADGIIDPLDTVITCEFLSGDVPPGSFLSSLVSIEIPPDTIGGTYYLGIILDPVDVEIEEDETNNTAVIPIEITPITDVPENEDMPSAVALGQNYPNPFNPLTTIRFDLPRNGLVKIEVFNVSGRYVATIIDEKREAGRHEVTWNGKDARGMDVASGMYFYRLTAGGKIINRKMLLVR